jgi:hypothetical protein
MSLNVGRLRADKGSMKQEWWPAKGVEPSQDDDRFLFLLTLIVSVLAGGGMVLYLALR